MENNIIIFLLALTSITNAQWSKAQQKAVNGINEKINSHVDVADASTILISPKLLFVTW